MPFSLVVSLVLLLFVADVIALGLTVPGGLKMLGQVCQWHPLAGLLQRFIEQLGGFMDGSAEGKILWYELPWDSPHVLEFVLLRAFEIRV